MKYNLLQNGNNGLGLGVAHFAESNTDAGQKDFNESTDIRDVNVCKVATNKDGEVIEYSEEVVAQIANDAAAMIGKPRTKKRVSSAIAMEV